MSGKTMFNYFSKLPSKAIVVEESNPRKLAPVYNKQHVEEFQTTRLERFDAELFNTNNNHNQNGAKGAHATKIGGNTNGNGAQESDYVSMDISTVTTYLDSVKTGQHKPFKLNRKPRGSLRARLLQYHEDVRPPYYGTWRRRSKKITGRRPFAMDDDIFDYEIDSEAEWDIGGPGESLKGDDSDDDEELDDYEIDMQTFVPHGYVSDDEVEVHSDQEEVPSNNPSMEEVCDDLDDSNASVKIVSEKGIKPQNRTEQAQPYQQQTTINQSPDQTTPNPPIKQVKCELKPITLGIYYENEKPAILSESKQQFLKAFQGVSCK